MKHSHFVTNSGGRILKKVNCQVNGKFIVPDTVVAIRKKAFCDCAQINEIFIPNTVKTIGDESFKNCSSLERIDIPESVTDVGKGAFKGCTSLREIIFHGIISLLKDETFKECRALKSITIPEGVQSLGDGVFGECVNLKEIIFSNSIESLGKETFKNCFSIETIDLPDEVKRIGDACFYGCKRLKALVLPKSLCKLGSQCFTKCDGLEAIIAKMETIDCLKSVSDIFGPIQRHPKCKLYVPFRLYQQYFILNIRYSFVELVKGIIDYKDIVQRLTKAETDNITISMPSIHQKPPLNVPIRNISPSHIETTSDFQELIVPPICYSDKELNEMGYSYGLLIDIVGKPDIEGFYSHSIINAKKKELEQELNFRMYFCIQKGVLLFGKIWTEQLIDKYLSPVRIIGLYNSSRQKLNEITLYEKKKVMDLENSNEMLLRRRNILNNSLSKEEIIDRWGNLSYMIKHLTPIFFDREERYVLEEVEQFETTKLFKDAKVTNVTQESENINKHDYYDDGELFAKGWTSYSIRIFLRKPNKTIGKINLYLKEKVSKVKCEKSFLDYQDIRSNSKKMLNLVKTRKMSQVEFVEDFIWKIPMVTYEILYKDAFESYVKNMNYYNDNEDIPINISVNDVDEKILAHICLCYLRHEFTAYDEIWHSLDIGFHDRLKSKVNTAIMKRYPWIKKALTH